MYYLIILEKGSNVQGVVKEMRKRGAMAEVVATPLKLSKNGCGYSIKLKNPQFDILNSAAIAYNVTIKERYKVTQEKMTKKYDKM